MHPTVRGKRLSRREVAIQLTLQIGYPPWKYLNGKNHTWLLCSQSTRTCRRDGGHKTLLNNPQINDAPCTYGNNGPDITPLPVANYELCASGSGSLTSCSSWTRPGEPGAWPSILLITHAVHTEYMCTPRQSRPLNDNMHVKINNYLVGCCKRFRRSCHFRHPLPTRHKFAPNVRCGAVRRPQTPQVPQVPHTSTQQLSAIPRRMDSPSFPAHRLLRALEPSKPQAPLSRD